MKHYFTRIIVLTILMLSTGMIMAQTYSYPIKGQQGFALTEKSKDGLHLTYELGQFSMSQVEYRGEELSEISIKAITIPNEAGLPNLPSESRMLAIPTGAKATMHVVRTEKQVIQNVNIAPALRIQAESEEPDMNYVKDQKVYSKNAFYPENPFVMGHSYIRGVDAVTVAVTPFQYNPVTKEMVVYTDIELSITYEGGNGHFGDDALRSPYWDPILAAELMNFDQLPVIDYEARMQQWLRDGADGAEYLIITPNNDEWAPYANQLKEYRTRQGIITEVYRLDEMPATTTTAMKQWFHDAYHTWTIRPVAVCLLGDHGTNMGQYIPAEVVFHSDYYGNCITDNRYADAEGNDNLPDMVFSRLVAQNANELPVFISKQIEYEYTNPNMDPSFYASPITALGWQTERWFQLCSEVFGGYMRSKGYTPNRINCIYDGTPGSIWSSNQNTSMVVDYFGPNGTGYIPASPTELGGWTGGTPDQVVQAVNNGAFWLQHRDHGLEEGWGEPAVRNSHIEQMNNVGKLPFVMSINCQTGMFDYTGSNGNCFTEKWMRRTYNGQNAGAVGVLSPTHVSYSFVNDAFVWGVYDLFDGEFMPTFGPFQPAAPKTGNWMPAFGNVAGKYFLAQSSWPYNTQSKDITYTMFTAHCDAFLRIYNQVPQAITANHQNVQLAGLTTFQITAPEGTTIALTKGEGENLEIVAVAIATGSAQNIEIPAQVPPTVLNLTITGQNYLRYEAAIEVIPAEGPYVIIDNYALANNAAQINFGDNSGFDLVFKNVGSETAPAGTATLTSESEHVTITNGTVGFEAISPNNTVDLNEAFSFTISDEVTDKTPIDFTVSITSGNDTYDNHISLKAYAPLFKIGAVSIDELNGNGNGRLDPGETVKLTFPIANNGHADSREIEATLSINNVFMQVIGEPNVTINGIAAQGSGAVEYTIYVGGAPSGFAADYALNIASGVYTDNKDFTSKIGLNVEDFELGNLDPTLWANDAANPWSFVTQQPYEGNMCLKSGSIGNNAETSIRLNFEVAEADSIAFYYKVSSEANYDKLFFYIDNQEMGNWSGNVNWTKAQYPVSAGSHTFQWKYKKDTSVNSGEDCAWIDFVLLPRDMSMAGSAGLDLNICEGSTAKVMGYAANYQTLLWTTSGDGTFDDATIANPVYTPGSQDIANGNVTLTMTLTGADNNTITDDMTINIFIPVSINYAIMENQYCAIGEPQGVEVTLEGDYTSFEWSTTGDGVFEDPTEVSTSYTPGPEDIANGFVMLTATAQTEGCGPVSFDYDFEMSPMPEITLEANILNICEGDNAIMNFSLNGVEENAVVVINDEPTQISANTTSIDFGVLAPGTTVFNINSISTFCGTSYDDLSFTVIVNERPSVVVDEVPTSICEGEEITLSFSFTGTAPFTVNATGMDSFTAEEENYTMTVTPDENVSITLLSLTDGNGCPVDLNETINVIVEEMAAIPEISGDHELDVRLNPTSTYTIANNVMVSYRLEPEEAGTIIGDYDDAMTIDIEWSDTFKGEAILTATPLSQCNNGGNSMAIVVKNTTGVDEFDGNARIYPNPTSDKVNIECAGMTHVTVFNALGQMVYNAEVDTDTMTINTETMPAGSYLVRITTAQGSFAKHLSIIK